jgi:hypothetical protein
MSRALALDSALALPGSAAAAVAWRAQGKLYVTVVVKATFAFASDAPMRLTKPQPIVWAEVHHANNPGRSILYTTDLAPALARADVLFTGSAHAVQAGAPVRSLPVRLALFSGGRPILDKRLLVQDPEGVTRLPLVYERTAIGPNVGSNPFGLASTEGVAGVVDPARPGHPAGFGPIGCSWPSRKHLLGSISRQMLDKPIAEIPDGFAWAYFQAAPADQQVDLLRGDEWILLEGLHPSLPFFRTRLPEAKGAARIHGLAAFGVPEGQGLDLVADTLRIEGDEQLATVVWRGSFPVAGEEALSAVRVVAGVAVGGEPLPWVDPVRAAARAAAPHHTHSATGGETLALTPEVQEEVSRRPVLGFGPRRTPVTPVTPGAGETIALSPELHEEVSRRPAHGFQPGAAALDTRSGKGPQGPAPSTGTLAFGLSEAPVERKDALPFHEGAAGGSRSQPQRHEVVDEATSALDLDLALASVLPFEEPTRGPKRAPPVDEEDGLDMATVRIRVADLKKLPKPAPPVDEEDGVDMSTLRIRVGDLKLPAPEPEPEPLTPRAPPPAVAAPPAPPPAPPSPEREPWAPAPPPALAPPPPPAPALTPPAASDTWKQGLYGRFGNKR